MMGDESLTFEPIEKEPEVEVAKKNESRVLLVVAHGEGMVLTWMAGIYMADFVSQDHAPEGEPFDAEDVDFEVPPDGLYLGEFSYVDDGPSDWGSPFREYALGIRNLRPVTAEEWASHRRGEFPWEPLEGSRFYETTPKDPNS